MNPEEGQPVNGPIDEWITGIPWSELLDDNEKDEDDD